MPYLLKLCVMRTCFCVIASRYHKKRHIFLFALAYNRCVANGGNTVYSILELFRCVLWQQKKYRDRLGGTNRVLQLICQFYRRRFPKASLRKLKKILKHSFLETVEDSNTLLGVTKFFLENSESSKDFIRVWEVVCYQVIGVRKWKQFLWMVSLAANVAREGVKQNKLCYAKGFSQSLLRIFRDSRISNAKRKLFRMIFAWESNEV